MSDQTISVGACPTCKGPVQFIDDGTPDSEVRHVDLSTVKLERFREIAIDAIRKVTGEPNYSPSDLLQHGAITPPMAETQRTQKVEGREAVHLPTWRAYLVDAAEYEGMRAERDEAERLAREWTNQPPENFNSLAREASLEILCYGLFLYAKGIRKQRDEAVKGEEALLIEVQYRDEALRKIAEGEEWSMTGHIRASEMRDCARRALTARHLGQEATR